MRVPQFMVGFGPTVFSRRRGETEYGIKAVPLGGYIRIVGMIPPAEEGESKRATRMRSFIAEVRGQALNDVLPTDGDRVFYKKPWWQRVIVMFAGPFHNLVLAVVFFTIVLTAFGHRASSPRRSARCPRACCRPARRPPAPTTPARCPSRPTGQTCEVGRAGCALPRRSPAAEAGLRPGDTIVAIDGEPVEPTRLRQLDGGAGRHPQQPRASRSSLTIERDGRRGATSPSPRSRTPSTPTPAATRPTHRVGYVGISPAHEPTCSSRSPPSPATSATIVVALGRQARRDPASGCPQLFRAAFLGEERDPNGPIGVVGVGRISGEVFALDAAHHHARRSAFFLSLLAGVNLVLFLFNLLPIYPLDGGHVAGALYEKARVDRRPAARPARPGAVRHRPADAGGLRGRRAVPGAVGAAVHRRHRQPDHACS